MNNTARVIRALQFLRIIDAQNNLSLTNLGVVAALVRLLCVPEISVHDLGVFLAAVVSYQVKRFAQPTSAPEDTTALQTAVAELQTKVTGLQMGSQLRRQ